MRKNIEYAAAPIEFEPMARVLENFRPIHNHNFIRGRPENRDVIFASFSDLNIRLLPPAHGS